MSKLVSILSFYLLFVATIVFPHSVDNKMAREVASHFLLSHNSVQQSVLKKKVSRKIDKIEALRNENKAKIMGYIAHINPKGFLILSADTDLEPVLAYSFRHNWVSIQNNILYQLLFGESQFHIERAKGQNNKATKINNEKWTYWLQQDNSGSQINSSFQQWPQPGSTSTGGWIETTWHQASPYNDYCPMDTESNERNLVGCVGTSMAQIVNYHRTIGNFQLTENDRYETKSGTIHIDKDSTTLDFPSFNELNKYLSQIEYKYENKLQLSDSEKAALNFTCAIITQTNFAWPNSGTKFYNAAASFVTDLGYFNADLLFPDSTFYPVLKANMINGFPAQLSISKNGSSISLHSVVADGYNTDGFFHLNFGWGANSPDAISDAWYFIPKNMGDGYNAINPSILDIKPVALPEPQLVVNEKLLDLPACRVGNRSESKNLILQNTGEESLVVDYIISTEHFSMRTSNSAFVDSIGPVTIPAGETFLLDIICEPEIIGQIKGDIIISYSTGRKYLSVNLFGHGIPADGTNVTTDSLFGNWDTTGSPYYITRHSFIPKNQKLEIGPGVRILFMGPYDLSIGQDAQFIVNGAENDSVYFGSINANIGWKGLRFNSSGEDDSLSFCVVTGCITFSNGGAFSLNNSSPMITNSRISGNQASYGGAISITNSLPNISHLKLTSNKATNGGAISIREASPSLSHLQISNNTADYGGAIAFYGSSATVTYSQIENNSSDSGGGALAFHNSKPVISNTTLVGNFSKNGGALYGSGSSPQIVNVTISKNKAQRGGAFYLSGRSAFIFKNSILWSNQSDSGAVFSFAIPPWSNQLNTAKFSFCSIESNSPNWRTWEEEPNLNCKVYWEHGNININPIFADITNNDFTLDPESPCIDAGDPNDDFGNEPFPHGYCVNIGAYGGTTKAANTIRATLTFAPNPVNFNRVQVYDKKEITCYLKNGSPATVNITDLSLSDTVTFKLEPFSKQINNGLTLQSGDIDSFKIIFSPTENTEKSVSGQLLINVVNIPAKIINVKAIVQYGRAVTGEVMGTWTLRFSPYYVTGDIEIPARKSLKIMPGVNVRFMENCKITVGKDARLQALGSNTNPIKFCAADTSLGWCGIEINNSGDDDILDNCIIRDANLLGPKSSRKKGGAIYIKDSSPLISNCQIVNNRAEIAGAIYFSNSDGHIDSSRIENNYSTISASAIKFHNSSPLITNTLICNNTSPRNSTIEVWDSFPSFINTTISHNNTRVALSLIFGSHVEVRNSILWGGENNTGELFDVYNGNSLKISYSDVDTLASNKIRIGGLLLWGPGNISQNPLFTNPQNGDYTLLSDSPCIDTGDPDTQYFDSENMDNPGFALWPAKGTLLNDMGAFGGGNHSTSPDTSNSKTTINKTLNFRLEQNYPNPFNPTTIIEYLIPSTCSVKVSIFDMLGRQVKNLVNSQQQPGIYRILWDGTNDKLRPVAAGIYFCKLESSNFSKTIKMVFIQ